MISSGAVDKPIGNVVTYRDFDPAESAHRRVLAVVTSGVAALTGGRADVSRRPRPA